MLKYFFHLEKLTKLSLWSSYSMLKAAIKAHNDIDIGEYRELKTYLQKQRKTCEQVKAKSLNLKQIEKFLSLAPDELYLMQKVVLIFGVVGSCRRDELYNILMNDIQDCGDHLVVTVRGATHLLNRVFVVNSGILDGVDFLKIYHKYVDIRPVNLKPTDRFFIRAGINSKTRQNVGVN